MGPLTLVAQLLGEKWWKYTTKLPDRDNRQSWKEHSKSAHSDEWIGAFLNEKTNLMPQNMYTCVDRFSVTDNSKISIQGQILILCKIDCPITRRSTSGLILILCPAVVSWI